MRFESDTASSRLAQRLAAYWAAKAQSLRGSVEIDDQAFNAAVQAAVAQILVAMTQQTTTQGNGSND